MILETEEPTEIKDSIKSKFKQKFTKFELSKISNFDIKINAYIQAKDEAFIGIIEKNYSTDTRDHYFMFGKIMIEHNERKIKGIFLGKIDHGYIDINY